MQEPELFLVFLRPLQKIGIDYIVTGSVAAIIYGEPRLTHDIDLIIDLKSDKIDQFHKLFDAKHFYVPPVEVLNVETARSYRGHFNLLHQKTGFKADIYLKGRDELHDWAFNLRRMEKINSHRISVAPPEYVILRKLMYYKEGGSEKHLDDIRNIANHSEKKINFKEFEKKVIDYSLEKYWNLI